MKKLRVQHCLTCDYLLFADYVGGKTRKPGRDLGADHANHQMRWVYVDCDDYRISEPVTYSRPKVNPGESIYLNRVAVIHREFTPPDQMQTLPPARKTDNGDHNRWYRGATSTEKVRYGQGLQDGRRNRPDIVRMRADDAYARGILKGESDD